MILDIVSPPAAESGPGEDHEAIVVGPDLSAVTAEDAMARVVEEHDEGGVAWSVDRSEESIEVGPGGDSSDLVGPGEREELAPDCVWRGEDDEQP